MFIQVKKIKGRNYYYLVHNVKKGNLVLKDFEKCLGNQEKVDDLFEQYKKVRQNAKL